MSEIGFGCGDVGGLDDQGRSCSEQVKAVARAMELGNQLLRHRSPLTATASLRPTSGHVLKDLSADVYVGTKFRVTTHEPGRIKGNVIASVEESLMSLQCEQVDLMQMHNHVASMADDGSVTPEETLGEVVDALRDLRDQGKVRFWGMTAVGETEALHRVIDSATLNCVQSVYNLVNPSSGSDVPSGFGMHDFGNLIGHASANGMGVAGDPGAGGGSADRGGCETPRGRSQRRAHRLRSRLQTRTSPGRRASGSWLQEGYVDNLVEASLRFALSNTGVSSVLVGYSSLEHLEQAVDFAAKGPLPAEAMDRLPEVWAGFGGA